MYGKSRPLGMSSRSSASFHVRRTRLPIPDEQELIPTACPLQAGLLQLMSVRVLRYCPPYNAVNAGIAANAGNGDREP
jgi:hypothetical protein